MDKLLFNAILFLVAIAWGRRAPASFLRVLGILCISMLCALAVEAVTGWLRHSPPNQPLPSESHRWTGHGMIIVSWLLMCGGVGGSLGIGSKFSGRLAALSAGCAILAVGVCLLESYTGYLLPDDPVQWQSVGQETHDRFFVMHFIVLPMLLTTVLAVWLMITVRQLRAFGQRRAVVGQQGDAPMTTTGRE